MGNAALTAELASGDWDVALAHGEEQVETLIQIETVAAALADAARWADLPPSDSITVGNGCGALERTRGAVGGIGRVNESGAPFAEESLTDTQRPW